MTASQSTNWRTLSHAYGVADDIPSLLRQLEKFPSESDAKAEPWFSLWSALYHQGDIYSASIASVPAIVDALSRAPGAATLSFYLLPTTIALADHANPIETPVEIRDGFSTSILRLGKIAMSELPNIVDKHLATAAKAAIHVSRGDYDQANGLLDSDA